MNDNKKVDITKYIQEGIRSGQMVPFTAVKYGRIIARPGVVGETVITWSVDSNGQEVKEKVDQVELDGETNKPGWIVTKVDEDGQVIIDSNGHINEWIIGDTKFRSKYEIDSEKPGLFKPKGAPQIFVRITEDIILEQWGSEMLLSAGSYINITNPNDIYGISERDFNDTYKIIDEEHKKTI